MNLYDRYVLPRLIDLTMRSETAAAERAKLVPLASGVVVEVGVGSGVNLRFYGREVRILYGLDPSPPLLAMAHPRAVRTVFPVRLLEASGEGIPLGDSIADTIVTTWTLCTIRDPVQALREMHRVLKPTGRLLFIEHGYAPEPRVQAWQDRLTPFWRRIGGGCHLNRKIDGLLVEGGFQIEHLSCRYAAGPRPFAYLYQGIARRAQGQTRVLPHAWHTHDEQEELAHGR